MRTASLDVSPEVTERKCCSNLPSEITHGACERKRRSMSKKTPRRWLGLFLTIIILGGASAVGLYVYAGVYGFVLLWRTGGTYWVSVSRDDPQLSQSMRVALRTEAIGQPGSLKWREIGRGLEVGELPVLLDGKEVDRILLTRLDPARYRLTVRSMPSGTRGLDDWQKDLAAAVVINGSYYGKKGSPATPVLSDGKPLGPTDYDAHQGAFVINGTVANIVDLAHKRWQDAFHGAQDALVSFPLLVGGASEHKIIASDWLANRSFVGIDRTGRVILGTTKDAFFSLARLAAFLQASPIELTAALNLDGGPVACQAVSVGSYQRRFCGLWETHMSGSTIKLLKWPFGKFALPVVLAAVPR